MASLHSNWLDTIQEAGSVDDVVREHLQDITKWNVECPPCSYSPVHLWNELYVAENVTTEFSSKSTACIDVFWSKCLSCNTYRVQVKTSADHYEAGMPEFFCVPILDVIKGDDGVFRCPYCNVQTPDYDEVQTLELKPGECMNCNCIFGNPPQPKVVKYDSQAESLYKCKVCKQDLKCTFCGTNTRNPIRYCYRCVNGVWTRHENHEFKSATLHRPEGKYRVNYCKHCNVMEYGDTCGG